MTVSVIIPTYNCASHIRSAVNSVLSQTLQSFEIIIVDDGSTDDTASIAKEYREENRIQYIYQNNQGVSCARNRGIYAASGQYIAFLDADDTIVPEALAVLVQSLEREIHANWCITDYFYVRETGKINVRYPIPNDPYYGILQGDFVARGFFYRTKALIEIGGYDEKLKTREDWDLNIRMLWSGSQFFYVAQPLYNYYFRSNSLMSSRSDEVLNDTFRVLRKHHKQLADSGDVAAARIYGEQLWDLGRRYLYSRWNLRMALRCAAESIFYDPDLTRITHAIRHHFSRSR